MSSQREYTEAERIAAVKVWVADNGGFPNLPDWVDVQCALTRSEATVADLEERLRAAEEAIQEIDRKAEAGLCCFKLGGARAFHEDIRLAVAAWLSAESQRKGQAND